MDRISEIQARLAAINAEIDTAEGEALTALENESRSLLDELKGIQDNAKARQELRKSIAAGAGTQCRGLCQHVDGSFRRCGGICTGHHQFLPCNEGKRKIDITY